MRVYWEIAARAFQRQLAYRTANFAGLITNVIFGYLRAAVFVALYVGHTTIGGYDSVEAITYLWVTQATVMVIAFWGWFDIAETIRTGDVVSDLSKPISYLGYWGARDAGRALYFALFRAVAVLVAGGLTFDLRWPAFGGWVAFAVSVLLATAISFALRVMLNLCAFWAADARGMVYLGTSAITFLSGFLVPLTFFPAWARDIVLLLPFAGMAHTPAGLFLERAGPSALLLQAVWAVVLLAAAQLMVAMATRRVLVQGG